MFGGQDSKPKGAKQAVSVKGGAERRQRQMMSVRHRAHGEMMKHVRGEESQADGSLPAGGGEGGLDVWAHDSKTNPNAVPLSLLPQLVQMIVVGENDHAVYHATLLIRKILSVEKEPPHDDVIASGVVPFMVRLLERFDHPQLQFEAAWALTNIAAGTTPNAYLLIDLEAVPRFIALLGSDNVDCRDQGAWAIGNMAGDCAAIRDRILELNALPALLHVLAYPDQPINVIRNAAWAVSNLCRGKPAPALDRVAVALPVLAGLLLHPDSEVVADALWSISYISDGPQERVQVVLESGVVPRVVELLGSLTTSLQTSSIRTVGNIVSGNDEQTQAIINMGVLGPMAELLAHTKRAIRKETCWAISNIAAGTMVQIDALINANIFPVLIQNCVCGMEFAIKKEAVWAIANVTLCGSEPQVRYLLTCNVIPPLCETLATFDSKIVTVALDALKNFLTLGDGDRIAGETEENAVALMVRECGGLDLLERLQTHSDDAVYASVLSILETFFALEDSTGEEPNVNFDYIAGFGGNCDQQNNGGFNF